MKKEYQVLSIETRVIIDGLSKKVSVGYSIDAPLSGYLAYTYNMLSNNKPVFLIINHRNNGQIFSSRHIYDCFRLPSKI